jgi:hypothetical protein
MNGKKWIWTAAALGLAATACSKASGNLSVSAAVETPAVTPSTSLDLGNGLVLDRLRVAVRKVTLEGGAAALPDGGPADGGAGDGGAGDAGYDDHGGLRCGDRMHGLVAARGGGDGGADDGSPDGGAGGGAGDGGYGDGGYDDRGGRGGDEDDDDCGFEDHDGEIKVGPFLVDLTGAQLAAGLNRVFEGEIPAGTYRELKVVIGVVSPKKAGADVALADMNGRSVVVEGTLDGKPFVFEAALYAAFKIEQEIVVSADGSFGNVTLTVDPARWFKAADGTRLDPTVPADQARIRANIKATLRAFDDRDRDGHDDHGGHGHGGDDGGHGPGHR